MSRIDEMRQRLERSTKRTREAPQQDETARVDPKLDDKSEELPMGFGPKVIEPLPPHRQGRLLSP